ncbi:MAG: hypothetical protein FJZ57_01960 [Chlamydiae bacterium]|nr:hypothetical protein [Chlamydiota bacterium]
MTICMNSAECLDSIMSRSGFHEALIQVRGWGHRIFAECSPNTKKVATIATEIFAKIAVNYIGITTIMACPISAVVLVPTLIIANLFISSIASKCKIALDLEAQSYNSR